MSSYLQSIYSQLLILIAIAIAIFAFTRWRLRAMRPTAATGALLLWCGALWILTNALEISSTDMQTALIWTKLEYFAMVPIPVLWLVLALQFTQREYYLTSKWLGPLVLVSVVILIVLLTNEYHGLFVSNARLEFRDSAANLVPDPGPMMVFFYVYAYMLIILGTLMLLQKLLRSRAFRWQGSVVLLGVVLSVGANILDWSRLNPVQPLKLTPLALTVSVPLFIITLVWARRADIVPVARSSVIQTMQDAVLVLDIENRIMDMNPAAEAIVGHRIAQVLGKKLDESWPEWDRQDRQVNTLSQRPGRSGEIRLGAGDLERVFDVRRSDLNDWRGQCTSRVIVLRDMTERAQAEALLQMSEEYFRALTENATDFVIILDGDALIRYVSPSIMRAFGFNTTEIVGKSTFDFIHSDERDTFLVALRTSAQNPGVAAPIVTRFHQADGGWRKLECIINNLLNHPAVRGIVVNARDVTERELVLEALQQSEERYRLHFTHINDVIYSFDTQLHVTSVSPGIERILGYTSEELLGKSLANPEEIPLLSPQYFEKAATEAIRVLSGERIEGAIYEFLAKDGTIRTAEISASPVFQNGQIIGAINVARDITDRLEAEERLRVSLAEKEVLLKEIHHRVKNNLQIISSLLNLQSGVSNDPVALAQLQDSQSRIRSMALIHERLYRSDNLTYVDLKEYLRDLSSSLVQTYRKHAQSISLHIEVDAILLDIDTAMPCGLLVNELISNAFKHAFPSGNPGEVAVEVHLADDSQVQLVVCDDGIGFPPDKNFQKPSSLGLQLVHSLAQQLDGTVQLYSPPGTKIVICFPKTSPDRIPNRKAANVYS